jgi:hypothetical protein
MKPAGITLLMKLGSICVHVEEMLSPKGHEFDRQAILGLLQDPEIRAWLKQMGPLLPQKR